MVKYGRTHLLIERVPKQALGRVQGCLMNPEPKKPLCSAKAVKIVERGFPQDHHARQAIAV